MVDPAYRALRPLAAALSVAIVACGCGPTRPAEPPSIVLFLADTLRADALGCYGNPVVETPAVDALAREGALFRNAYAQSSWTRASIASILTGLYPEAHRVRDRDSRADERLVLLSEQLAARGYATAAIVTNPNVGSFYGFDQGFAEFEELYRRHGSGRVRSRELITPSDAVVQRALDWIAGAPRPFFLFVLTIDPHWPYDPPPEFDRYGGDYRGPLDEGGGRSRALALPEADRERIRSFYYGEVAFNDASFARLMRGLREAGIADDTAVVFTSDHGEEFWEHHGRWHGTHLFQEAIRVPLVIRYPPAIARGLVVERPVQLVDLMPTLLELAGAPVPAGLDGRSLLAEPEGEPPAAFASLDLDGQRVMALVAPPWKLIWYPDSDRRALFRLDRDADERVDLQRPGHGESGILLERLRARAQESARKARGLAAAPSAGERPLPDDVRDALEALGYVDAEETP